MAKQILLDLLIVIALPLLVVFGYFYLKSDEGSALLSAASRETVALPGQERKELGVKTKTALAELSSINFDESIFSDPAFLSLKDFTEEIDPTPIGRDYPFTAPDELRNMSRQNAVKTNLAEPDFSTKLNILKESRK